MTLHKLKPGPIGLDYLRYPISPWQRHWQTIKDKPKSDYLHFYSSRTRRCFKRGFPALNLRIYAAARSNKLKQFTSIRARNLIILPVLVGYTLKVYTGKAYVPVEIKPAMIGYKIGNFVPTRRRPVHKKAVKTRKSAH